MTRRVSILPNAARSMNEAYRWYLEHAPHVADRWYHGLLTAIKGLSSNPERFGLAHESDDLELEVRELLFGVGRRKSHRVFFLIHADRVEVVAVRHVAQRDLSSDDLQDLAEL
ncbi:MAG: type II toxin-antitoxin system RelE/ParE family toxin [Planctomycetes bacterium]|nr:type II toxin-antitoxin system RelE/ParE family toxin [Planctomycetota bacterium]